MEEAQQLSHWQPCSTVTLACLTEHTLSLCCPAPPKRQGFTPANLFCPAKVPPKLSVITFVEHLSQKTSSRWNEQQVCLALAQLAQQDTSPNKRSAGNRLLDQWLIVPVDWRAKCLHRPLHVESY